MLVLFGLMIGTGWDDITRSSINATNALMILYFVSFYIVVVVIVMNLFLAIILEAYAIKVK